MQGAKVRNIDDLSEVNQCYGPGEKLDLGGADEVVLLAPAWMRTFGNYPDRAQVELLSGLVLSKHEEFRGRGLSLSGRCLDLKAAYKQLALAPSDQSCAVIAMLDPEISEVRYFISYALPFGATGSVMAFNRAARAFGIARDPAEVPTITSYQLLRRFSPCRRRAHDCEVAGGHRGGLQGAWLGNSRRSKEEDSAFQEVCGVEGS